MNEINLQNIQQITPITDNTPKQEQKAATDNHQQTDLSVLNNQKRDLVQEVPRRKVNRDDDDFDMFVVPKNIRTLPHAMYHYHDRRTSFVLMKLKSHGNAWNQTPFIAGSTTPWKMHIYADTEEDWVKLLLSVGRYLITKKVDWKTLSAFCSVEDLNSDEKQKGKAFTIYTKNKEQFKELARDLDYIIRLNGLEKEDSNIAGDRKLGTTGRIFYRYECDTGKFKDSSFSYDNNEEMDEYHEHYDANRGEDKYLAPDMTVEDDPFYDFDPQFN